MPINDQIKGFNDFIDKFRKHYNIIKHFSTKDKWIILIDKITNFNELQPFLIKSLNEHSWTNNHKWNNGINEYICSRPISNIIIKEIKSESEIPQEPIYPTLDFASPWQNTVFFRQLEHGQLNYVNLKYNKLPHELIKSFLWKEHLALYDGSQAVLWVKPNISSEQLERALNAKIFDCEEMWLRDLTKDYKKLFHNREFYFMNGDIFHIKMKEIISQFLKLNNIQVNETYLMMVIDHYKIDRTSEIVNEFPHLEGIVTYAISGISDIFQVDKLDSDIKKIIYVTEVIIMINSLIDKDITVSSSYDPYGVRGSMKKLAELGFRWIELINEGVLKQWIINRIEKQLNESVKLLNCSVYDKYYYNCKNLTFDIKIINRLKNLINVDCKENISLSNEELELENNIKNMNIENINTIIEKLSKYIENYKIFPYIERKEIIKKFLNNFK